MLRTPRLIPKTASGLVSGARIPFGDRRFFNRSNDHNPVVGARCQSCNGSGRFGEVSDIPCFACKGVGALNQPVHFFNNDNAPAEARVRADCWITCPGCSHSFSLERGDWTGWRHACGQRIILLPPKDSSWVKALLLKWRWKWAKERKHILWLLDGRWDLLSHLWIGAAICFIVIHVVWYSGQIGVDPELKKTDLFRWYSQHRHALRPVGLFYVALGFVSTLGTSWLTTCVLFRRAYRPWLSIDNDGLSGCLSWLLGFIYLTVPPLLTTHFVYPIVTLRGRSVSSTPSALRDFMGNVLSNTWIVVGWTATFLGLIASVITIYEALRKSDR